MPERVLQVQVYQPAMPLRAVLVYGRCTGSDDPGWYDLDVLGCEVRLIEDGEETEERHSVLFWSEEYHCPARLDDPSCRESDCIYDQIIVAPANKPADWWAKKIANRMQAIRGPEQDSDGEAGATGCGESNDPATVAAGSHG